MLVCDFLSCTVYKLLWIISEFFLLLALFKALVWGEREPLYSMKFGINKLEKSPYHTLRNVLRYLEPRIGVPHKCDRQTDRQNGL